jgi:hypothetical protein
MNRRGLSAALIAGAMFVGTMASAHGKKVFVAGLDGYEEVPSISTAAHGHLWLRVSPDEQLIEYKLAYGGLSSPAVQAHLHLGRKHTNGGVIVALCRGPAASDVEDAVWAPACPDEGPGETMVEGTISAQQVIGPSRQGIAPGQIRELVRALRANAVYVNVHTVRFPSGEVRGQIR